jgi:hypothetical protein
LAIGQQQKQAAALLCSALLDFFKERQQMTYRKKMIAVAHCEIVFLA